MQKITNGKKDKDSVATQDFYNTIKKIEEHLRIKNLLAFQKFISEHHLYNTNSEIRPFSNFVDTEIMDYFRKYPIE